MWNQSESSSGSDAEPDEKTDEPVREEENPEGNSTSEDNDEKEKGWILTIFRIHQIHLKS